MPAAHVFQLAGRRALTRWSAAHRLACRAEAELADAELRHARGEGAPPSELLRRTASMLRERANALRGASATLHALPSGGAQVLPFVRRS